MKCLSGDNLITEIHLKRDLQLSNQKPPDPGCQASATKGQTLRVADHKHGWTLSEPRKYKVTLTLVSKIDSGLISQFKH